MILRSPEKSQVLQASPELLCQALCCTIVFAGVVVFLQQVNLKFGLLCMTALLFPNLILILIQIHIYVIPTWEAQVQWIHKSFEDTPDPVPALILGTSTLQKPHRWPTLAQTGNGLPQSTSVGCRSWSNPRVLEVYLRNVRSCFGVGTKTTKVKGAGWAIVFFRLALLQRSNAITKCQTCILMPWICQSAGSATAPGWFSSKVGLWFNCGFPG